MKPLTANDLIVGGKYKLYNAEVEYLGSCTFGYGFKGSNEYITYTQDLLNLTPYTEPNECCGRCDGVNDFCINEKSTMMELKSLHEPNQPTMNTEELKDNKIMLLEEDLWCVHRYFDDLKIPRVDKDEKEYSIVGRIKRLEERYLKQMSEIETQNLSDNYTEQPFNLETALKHPEWVRTRDGREIDFIKEYSNIQVSFNIAYVTKNGRANTVDRNGRSSTLGIETNNDLILRVPYIEMFESSYNDKSKIGSVHWYRTIISNAKHCTEYIGENQRDMKISEYSSIIKECFNDLIKAQEIGLIACVPDELP
jgi:hypothetical protein